MRFVLSAFKAGAVGVALILIFGAFSYYMYERDQYNFWHSEASLHMDNFCVGVLWIPFFLIAVALTSVFAGALSVRLRGNAVSSKQDMLTISLLTGIMIWAVNLLFILAFFAANIWRSIVQEGYMGISSLVSLAFWCAGYLIAQASLTTIGGLIEVLRIKK